MMEGYIAVGDPNDPRLPHASIVNDVGGTTELPAGTYRVVLTGRWDDYEIGARATGLLVTPGDIEVARKTGTTGYRSDDDTTVFRPDRVYFPARAFTSNFEAMLDKLVKDGLVERTPP